MGTHPIFESDFDCLTEWPQFSPGTESSDTALLPLVSTTASMLTTSSLSSELTSERKKSKSPRLTWSRLTSPTSLSRKRARRTPTFSEPSSQKLPTLLLTTPPTTFFSPSKDPTSFTHTSRPSGKPTRTRLPSATTSPTARRTSSPDPSSTSLLSQLLSWAELDLPSTTRRSPSTSLSKSTRSSESTPPRSRTSFSPTSSETRTTSSRSLVAMLLPLAPGPLLCKLFTGEALRSNRPSLITT